MSTIQLDFNLPERFDLEYTAARRLQAAPGHDPPRAVRLDRAVLRGAAGALRGRVPGVAGAGPGGRHPDRRRARRRTCRSSPPRRKKQGLRVEVDASSDRMQKKIRNAQKQKVPFMVIAGDEDMAERRGLLPLPRRLAGERHPASTRPSRRSSKVVEERASRSDGRSVTPRGPRREITLPGGPCHRSPRRPRAKHLQQPGGEGPGHRAQQGQPADHQHHRDQSGRAGSRGRRRRSPTVVSVEQAHHTASPKVRIVAPGRVVLLRGRRPGRRRSPAAARRRPAYAITRAYRLSRGSSRRVAASRSYSLHDAAAGAAAAARTYHGVQPVRAHEAQPLGRSAASRTT